jgi:hypothetical protein
MTRAVEVFFVLRHSGLIRHSSFVIRHWQQAGRAATESDDTLALGVPRFLVEVQEWLRIF